MSSPDFADSFLHAASRMKSGHAGWRQSRSHEWGMGGLYVNLSRLPRPSAEGLAMTRGKMRQGLWVPQAFIVIINVAHDKNVSPAFEGHAVFVVHIGLEDAGMTSDRVGT